MRETVYAVYEYPVGRLRIECRDGAITRLARTDEPCRDCCDCLLLRAKAQLDEYFAGTRKRFDLPLHAEGTAFQKKVWAALETIPYGEQRSYQNIADQLGRPGAARAVGAACGANPLPIVVPCHRVVRSDGALGGYALGTDVKKSLLELEQKAVLRT